MAQAVHMSKIWKARRMILQEVPVPKIAKELMISESTVLKYTKSERARMKGA